MYLTSRSDSWQLDEHITQSRAVVQTCESTAMVSTQTALTLYMYVSLFSFSTNAAIWLADECHVQAPYYPYDAWKNIDRTELAFDLNIEE